MGRRVGSVLGLDVRTSHAMLVVLGRMIEEWCLRPGVWQEKTPATAGAVGEARRSKRRGHKAEKG